ncbi:UNVERIFIED_ORG: hypothetical protein J2W19_003200 [Shinella zoogloeoides]|nr:hypothetical protein [Shinella zoogloeoides]
MTSPVSAIEAIEKAMEGVTHGDWYLAGKLTIRHASPVGGTHGWIGKVNWQNGEANAAYITACSPDSMREVLALARQAEALQRENAELRSMLERCAPAERSKSWLPVPLWNDARALLGGSEHAE